MAESRRYSGCKTICHSSSLYLIAYPLQKRLPHFFFLKKKVLDPARLRTWNLLIRSQMPYPLGHGASRKPSVILYIQIRFHVSKSI